MIDRSDNLRFEVLTAVDRIAADCQFLAAVGDKLENLDRTDVAGLRQLADDLLTATCKARAILLTATARPARSTTNPPAMGRKPRGTVPRGRRGTQSGTRATRNGP